MELTITPADAGRRLNKFLFAYLNNAPHSFIYRMIRQKRIKLNGKKAQGNEVLSSGDRLIFYLSPETIESSRRTRDIPVAQHLTGIVHEDDFLLVLNKSAGVPSQGGFDSNESSTDHLLARALHYLHKSGSYDPSSSFTPALCNRLDVNTTGLVVCGKNISAIREINTLFSGLGIVKEYITVVEGRVSHAQTLEGFYKKDTKRNIAKILPTSTTGKVSSNETVITSYAPLAANDKFSLLLVSPKTGRSHQIRAHLASAGHPIAGDMKYGGRPIPYAKHGLLHCKSLEIAMENKLPYPISTKWEAPLPENLKKCIKDLFNFER